MCANERTFTHVLPATRTITQQRGHEHQPRRARDRTLSSASGVHARALTRSGRSSSSCTTNSSCYTSSFSRCLSSSPASPDPSVRGLMNLYYDLTCQDLGPEFEDRHETFFARGSGHFMQLMVWVPPQLQMDVRCCCLASACVFTRRLDLSHFQSDEPMPSLPSRIRNGIIEIAEVHASTFFCLFI